jgi:hypothetical protein
MLTITSTNSNDKSPMTLNSYLYAEPSVQDRLMQGCEQMAGSHQARAVENIEAFEYSFEGK